MCVATLCPFFVTPKKAFIADLKTKAFDSLGLLGNKRDYWEAQLLGYLDPVRDFAAFFYAVKFVMASHILYTVSVLG